LLFFVNYTLISFSVSNTSLVGDGVDTVNRGGILTLIIIYCLPTPTQPVIPPWSVDEYQ